MTARTQNVTAAAAGGIGAIAVVGAGLAGAHAARSLREHGFTGRLVVFGAEEHLPYDRPPLSKRVLTGAMPADGTLLPFAAALDVEWRLGCPVASLDAATCRLGLPGGSEEFPGGIVIATGAVPRRFAGADLPGVHVLRTTADAGAIAADFARRPEQVVIVGGGFIGAEVAASARQLGLSVTLIEMTPLPFEQILGHEVAAAITRLHIDRGVRVIAGATVTAVHGTASVTAVELSDGRSIPADVVVLGLGVQPGTGWLAGSGLEISDGVVCDATLLAAPRIVAAGDVTRWQHQDGEHRRIEHWDNAVLQGRHAGRRLLAEHGVVPAERFTALSWIWSDQYDRKIQILGSPAGADEAVIVTGSAAEGSFVALYRRADQLAGVVAVNLPRELARYRAMLVTPTSWSQALAAAAP
jgi:NADPH-dependent 2,4-dienoyl-CoA reductase/sulfur reductase-like enzyme